MQTVTLDNLLNGDADPDGEIYILRDGKCVLYAGKAASGIAYRWTGHYNARFGRDENGLLTARDQVAAFVLKNLPQSLQWQLDCYDAEDAANVWLADYLKIIKEKYGLTPNYAPDRMRLEKVEEICITVLRPCLNVSGNSNPNKLPAKYARLGY